MRVNPSKPAHPKWVDLFNLTQPVYAWAKAYPFQTISLYLSLVVGQEQTLHKLGSFNIKHTTMSTKILDHQIDLKQINLNGLCGLFGLSQIFPSLINMDLKTACHSYTCRVLRPSKMYLNPDWSQATSGSLAKFKMQLFPSLGLDEQTELMGESQYSLGSSFGRNYI